VRELGSAATQRRPLARQPAIQSRPIHLSSCEWRVVQARVMKHDDRRGRQCLTFRAKHRAKRGGSHVRPEPALEHLAGLLLAANGLVAQCKNPSCGVWFSSTTAKQEYCTPRCSERGRKCASRRRKGVKPRKAHPSVTMFAPRSAGGALTHTDWQDYKYRPRI
jgi:hypothetical protein